MEIKYYKAINKNNKEQEYAEFNNVIFGENKKYFYALKNKIYPRKFKLHHAVFCYYNNITKIPKGYVIHHKDFNKLNNDISNLQLLTISEHVTLHNNNMSVETKQKISKKAKNRIFSNEHKKNLSKSKENISIETRKKMSESAKKKIFTTEHKNNISLGKKGEKNVKFIKFNDEQIKLIIKSYKDGIPVYKIGDQFNVSKAPIYRILKEFGLK